MSKWKYRTRPEVGKRIEHWHPHLGEGCFGTVSWIEELPDRWRVHLTECIEYGDPAQDTYMDEYGETWRYVE